MRKIFKSFMLVAAAAMAFASCQKEEKVAPETISATLTMHADIEATKTYLGEENTVFWGTDEAVTLYVGSGETAKFFDSASTDANDGKASASFTFAMEGVTEADSYALGGIYPASAAEGINNNDNPKSYKVALSATQNQGDGNYDPSAYIMVLKPEIVDVLPTEYTASFRRATALNKVTLTNVAEDITSVEITVPAEKYLAGRRYFDLTTGESGEVYESGTQTNVVKVNGDFKSGSFDVWFCSWGVELVEGEALTVKMASANNTYTRTITARAEGIKFVEGDLNTLTINMKEADVEAISTITGDYLIASKTSSGWFLMTPTNGSSYYTATGNVSSSSAVTCADFYDVADVENYVWKVAKYDNGYSIQSVYTNKYVAYSGSSNQAYANAELSDAVKMDIQLNGQDAVIESMNVSGRKLQYNAGSPRFAFYGTAQTSVYLISWTPDTTPRITVEDTEYNVSADDETLEFSYTTKNIDGTPTVSVADGATMTNVEADAEAGIVTVIFDANAEEEEKTATLVLSYEGAESVSVTITQAAKAAAGAAYYEKVTSAPADWSGNYLIVFGSSAHATNSENKDLIATTSVSITDNKIAATDALAGAVMTVTKSGDKYHMTYPDGNYFGMAKNASTAVTSAFDLTFSYTDSGVKISGVVSGTTYILYSNNGNYFRCYTDKTGTSGYTLPTLYKLSGNSEGEGGETPEPELQERNLAFSSTTATATVGEDFTEPTLNGATAGVTYSSSNTSVATVNETTGAVTLVAAGETTITATAAADATHKAGKASYTLTVSDEGGETTGGYTLVTSLSDITTGQYVIAAKVDGTYYAMSNTYSSKINGTAVTVTDNIISESNANNYVVTITKTGDNYTIQLSGKYLSYGTTGTNFSSSTTSYNWNIVVGTYGSFRIKATTGSNRAIMWQQSGSRFGPYATTNASGYNDIELFKLAN